MWASLSVPSRAGGLSSHGPVPFPFFFPSLLFSYLACRLLCVRVWRVGVRSPGGRAQKRTAIVLDNRCYYSEHSWDASPFGFPAPTDGFVVKAFVRASVLRAPAKYCKLASCQRRMVAGRDRSRPEPRLKGALVAVPPTVARGSCFSCKEAWLLSKQRV